MLRCHTSFVTLTSFIPTRKVSKFHGENSLAACPRLRRWSSSWSLQKVRRLFSGDSCRITMMTMTLTQPTISECSNLRCVSVVGVGATTGRIVHSRIPEKRLGEGIRGSITIRELYVLSFEKATVEKEICASTRMAYSSLGYTQLGIEQRRVKTARIASERFVFSPILPVNFALHLHSVSRNCTTIAVFIVIRLLILQLLLYFVRPICPPAQIHRFSILVERVIKMQ